MRVLIISDEVWNDQIHGNNILSNWFDEFQADFANIYLSPGLPKNKVCYDYFQITDKMVVNSYFRKNENAGRPFRIDKHENDQMLLESNFKKPKKIIETMRLVRDILWYYAKYDEVKLKKFIEEFNPDIVFSPRLATIKILRVERLVQKLSTAPFVAFTGDAEYTFRKFRFSPIFWTRKILMRKMFRSNMSFYKKYYLFSKQQLDEYEIEFGKKFDIIHKGYPLVALENPKNIADSKRDIEPLKIIYAGKLYSNRWKTLLKLAKNINVLNIDKLRYELHIYTRDKFNKRVSKQIKGLSGIFIHEPVSPLDLNVLIKSFDIALHVESFDIKNRLLTRLSISTKIVDYLASGCAIMVIAWKSHSALQYLEENDSALIIKKGKEINPMLLRILDDKKLIDYYKTQAKKLLSKNHNIDQIRNQFFHDFEAIIEGSDYFEDNSN